MDTESEEVHLCRLCADMMKTIRDRPPTIRPSRIPHNPTYGSLLLSGETCTICRLIASLWDHAEGTLTRHGVPPTKETQREYDVDLEMTEVERAESGVCWAFVEAQLHAKDTGFTFVSHFTPMAAFDTADPVSTCGAWKAPASSFDDKLAAIGGWMQECRFQDGHENCRPVPYAPLRLLAIDPDEGPLRLVQRQVATDPTTYATLSYCWGSSLPLRTTKATVSQFGDEIPEELIPKTWADAIRIARALRIPHIWIDALCIVQDDEAEWQAEVERMSEIYQGSMLTIAAVQSSDSSGGCFPSHLSRLENSELFFRTHLDRNDSASSVVVRVYQNDIRTRSLRNTAISNRGWTLQENILSPRILHCMQPEAHWQCRASYCTETGLKFSMEGLSVVPSTHHLMLATPPEYVGHRTVWRRIVQDYSSREFTYPRDRVPAIAGITKYFSSILDDAPILGLWRGSFAADLAWLMGSSHGSQGLEAPGRATGVPSWTWLACQGRVWYYLGGETFTRDRKLISHTELLRWDVQWLGVPFASPVTSAQVTVRGPVKPIRIVPFESGNRCIPPYFQVFDENLQPSAGHRFPWRCAGRFDDRDRNTAATYMCLHLISEPRGVGADGTMSMREVFLILEPFNMDGGAITRYKRVGLARIWGDTPTFNANDQVSLVLI
ncbi:heterokaryon incompatibility protein-domain-containing protein [Cercophora newfieldiana]|uniref:Heterokaryon incompatibility protein-domain-containing protein n=1 Tax=Cercophora newfieldiana TaxID=92897 RepID=A0AA39YJI0_9PEZI|nr:heterokaryon incompatibility protein-domain-containing protein [Cercophora newfieldiana]